MKKGTVRAFYWTTTVFFSLMMLADGIAGVMWVEDGQKAMLHLGYPLYVLTIFGTAKILGALAIIQTKYKVIKEWAFAGFAINFLGAFASRLMVGDEISLLIPPVIALGIMFVPYYFWKRVERLKEDKEITIAGRKIQPAFQNS